MKSRKWVLPALLVLPFVVTGLIDVFRAAVLRPPEDVALLGPGATYEFEATALMADLRSDPRVEDGEVKKAGVELGPGWGEISPQGRWTAGHRFEVGMTLGVGGQTAFYLEGRVDRNQNRESRLAVRIGQREAGTIDLSRSMSERLLMVPEGLIRAGDNRLEFRLVDPSSGADDLGRTALIRRLAVAADNSGGFPAPQPGVAVRSDLDGGTLVVLAEGRLTLPFEVTVSGSELEFRYTFRNPEPGARCRVVVGRRYSDPGRFDVVRKEILDAGGRGSGGFRQVLQDRGEPSALFVHVNAAAARNGFVLQNPRIDARPVGKGGRAED
jgi:hypothetical protein